MVRQGQKSICLGMVLAIVAVTGLGAAVCYGGQKGEGVGAMQLRGEFINPSATRYGPAPLWWWVGEPLTRERLGWQLKEMKDKGICNPSVIYNHGPDHRAAKGEPLIFTEKWWDLWRWAVDECDRLGMTIMFSDYTIVNHAQADIAKENPNLKAVRLKCINKTVESAGPIEMTVSTSVLSAMVYRVVDEAIEPGSGVDLRGAISNGVLKWEAPEGKWQVAVVHTIGGWLDPTNPKATDKFIEKLYSVFDKEYPGQLGKTISGWFQDELTVGGMWRLMPLWSSNFVEEFRRRKGYDITPLLPGLWHDIGSKTPKVRIDYFDVIVSLIEENYFRPIFDYNQKFGLIHGHDNGGRHSIRDQVILYGDYYRTMRWYSMPGYDDYFSNRVGDRNLDDGKLASSISHLYQRRGVWCEGFHSTGWGRTTSDLMSWLNENFSYGMTMFDNHGVFYTSYGSWWEWGPPSVYFRQPYWMHYGSIVKYMTRLGYLLSQGVHRCDVAVLYPVTTMHAGITGDLNFDEQAQTVQGSLFKLARHLFNKAIDFDYIDHESVARAEISGGELSAAGERYRVLLLPATAAVRYETLKKALEFYRAGGVVIAYKCLPQASDRAGRDDSQVDAMVREIFGITAEDAKTVKDAVENRNAAGGVGAFVPDNFEEINRIIDKSIQRDFIPLENDAYVLHRVIGEQDIYFVFNIRNEVKDLSAFFRAKGYPEAWDAWTGETLAIHRFESEGDGTRVRLRMEPYEAKLIVFRGGSERPGVVSDNLYSVESVTKQDGEIKVTGICRKGGEKRATVVSDGKKIEVKAVAAEPAKTIELGGLWDFELEPTMNNRWGDFRLPIEQEVIGAEARRFKYADETGSDPAWYQVDLDDSKWEQVTYSHGPYFWKLGPITPGTDTKELESQLAAAESIGADSQVKLAGAQYNWSGYQFSRRWGIERDPMLQFTMYGPHGLKQRVPEEFIDLSVDNKKVMEGEYRMKFIWDAASPRKRNPNDKPGAVWYMWTSVHTEKATETWLNFKATGVCQAWINGDSVLSKSDRVKVSLKAGTNRILVKFVQPQKERMRGYVVLGDVPAEQRPLLEDLAAKRLGLHWFYGTDAMVFDSRPEIAQPAGWYRFSSPPGMRQMQITAHGKVSAWVNGRKETVQTGKRRADGSIVYTVKLEKPESTLAKVAVRIEQERGYYGGAAIAEPVLFDCAPGKVPLGCWTKLGLECYSGAAWYRKDVKLDAEHIGDRVMLNLGNVATTAKVIVNGQTVGVDVCQPWSMDITRFVRQGKNRIEVQVANTLANHYNIGIPSAYVYGGQEVSGLLGPVRIESLSKVQLRGQNIQ